MSSVSAYRGWDTRREREEAVTVNLPADLLPLWERTKAQFKGSPERRAELFLEYAEEHQGERVEALQDHADAKLEALIAQREAA